MRRAVAIQLIINRELGLAKNENPLQGSFVIEYLTDLVEAAVLEEFDRISSRGGVLGAMERQYQRTRIQEESLYYERRKESGEYPIIGVNTYPVNGRLADRDRQEADQVDRRRQGSAGSAELASFQTHNSEMSPLALHSPATVGGLATATSSRYSWRPPRCRPLARSRLPSTTSVASTAETCSRHDPTRPKPKVIGRDPPLKP